MSHHIPRAFAAGCAVAAGIAATSAPAFAADFTAHLTAAPTSYNGRCPATIHFRGYIRATKPGTVRYKFIRSDGASAPIQSVTFAAPGIRNVATTWQLGGPALPNYAGWEAIEIVHPAASHSNKAAFRVHCAGTPGGPGPGPGAGKADLIIQHWGLKRWGSCTPGSPIFVASVTVKNIGTATVPAIPGKALVQVMHTGTNWGNGAIVAGSIPAGHSRTVEIPVYYLKSNPGFMTANAPHPFRAIADPLHLVSETNEGNNQGGIVNIDPRGICRAKR